MAAKHNPVNWFEIPAVDVDRAMAFYKAVFGLKLTKEAMGPSTLAFFPMVDGQYGAAGALMKGQRLPPLPHRHHRLLPRRLHQCHPRQSQSQRRQSPRPPHRHRQVRLHGPLRGLRRQPPRPPLHEVARACHSPLSFLAFLPAPQAPAHSHSRPRRENNGCRLWRYPQSLQPHKPPTGAQHLAPKARQDAVPPSPLFTLVCSLCPL